MYLHFIGERLNKPRSLLTTPFFLSVAVKDRSKGGGAFVRWVLPFGTFFSAFPFASWKTITLYMHVIYRGIICTSQYFWLLSIPDHQ